MAENDRMPEEGTTREDSETTEGATQNQAQAEEDGSPDEEGAVSRTAHHAARFARDGAAWGQHSVITGYSAMRQVGEAKRQTANARAKAASIQKDLDADKVTLEHRDDYASRFDQIVAEQTAERDGANRAAADAQATIDELTKEHDDLAAQLDQMKKDHELQLRPYKNLAESTRSRADDAGRTLADAKRAQKTAESQVSDATNRRDTRVSAANRAVDNASARLQKLQAELDTMQKDPSSGLKALSELRSGVAAELAHLENAKAEVTSVMDETQKLVDNAQSHLWTAKQSVEVAEKQADAAKREARDHKEAYDKLAQDAETQEATLDNAVVEREMGIRDATKELKAAQDHAKAAQDVLDEANGIHSTPEVTEQLRASVSDQEAALAVAQRETDALAEAERTVRERTRQQRLVFFAIIAVLVVIVAIVLWFTIGPK